jgi:Oxidoreductase family, NAD-binding Rossmann fold
MATEKIHVGIIGANVRYGWGRDTHIPALSALPEFEITAICTSRKETADETAKHFGIPHPYKMVQHPGVDLVSICVRVPFHHQLGMAALNAGKHLYCEWPLAATTEQAQQMRDLAVRKGSHHMAGLQARGARAFNRVKDLVADGYVGKVLSCTMIVSTPTWGSEFTHDWAYMADRSNGNTLLTSPGGHHLTRCASAPPTGRGSCSRSMAPRATWLSCRQILSRRLTYRSPSSLCAVRRRANRWRISRYRRATAGFHPRSRRGSLSTLRRCTCA